MKNLLNVKRNRNRGVMFILVLLSLTISCSRIYDNIEKYASHETIYAERLDGILKVQYGYERVEIDLLEAGRIPSSMIEMTKATKTVIESPEFTEPGHRRVIDSVCSWVNITGLTELKTYQLTIYTEDDHGNRSLPFYEDVVPFTAVNINALALTRPNITEYTSSALIEWSEPISATTHRVLRYSYHYIDMNGVNRTGISQEGDMPSFLVENIERGKDIPVTLTCRTIPYMTQFDGTSVPILDTVNWRPVVILRIN